MKDTFEFTLNSPLTEEQWDMITDTNLEKTDSVQFHTKSGNVVEFVKVIRCRDCMWRNSYDCRWSEDFPPQDNDYCSYAKPKESE